MSWASRQSFDDGFARRDGAVHLAVLPQAFLLDLDDTILNDSGQIEACWRDACAEGASERGDIDADALYQTIEKMRNWFWSDVDRHRRGRLDLDAATREVVALALAELGAPASAAASMAAHYRRRRDEMLEPFPDAIDTVRWLRTQGCRLALLTNGSTAMQRAKITRFGLADLFDAILVEGELGFGKPDPRVYTRALEELAVPAAAAWMVGDNLEWDVAQPQRMGIAGIWIDVRGGGLPENHTIRPSRILRRLSELRELT